MLSTEESVQRMAFVAMHNVFNGKRLNERCINCTDPLRKHTKLAISATHTHVLSPLLYTYHMPPAALCFAQEILASADAPPPGQCLARCSAAGRGRARATAQACRSGAARGFK